LLFLRKGESAKSEAGHHQREKQRWAVRHGTPPMRNVYPIMAQVLAKLFSSQQESGI
jgi:hypothetical protein